MTAHHFVNELSSLIVNAVIGIPLHFGLLWLVRWSRFIDKTFDIPFARLSNKQLFGIVFCVAMFGA